MNITIFGTDPLTLHAAAELFRVNKIGELGENHFSSMHPESLAKRLLRENG